MTDAIRLVPKPTTQTFRVGIIGLGKLGLPCAELMAQYYEVEGCDTVPVQPCNFTTVANVAALCEGKDLIFIAAPTPHEASYGGEVPSGQLPPRDFDYGILKGILRVLNQHATPIDWSFLSAQCFPGLSGHNWLRSPQTTRWSTTRI